MANHWLGVRAKYKHLGQQGRGLSHRGAPDDLPASSVNIMMGWLIFLSGGRDSLSEMHTACCRDGKLASSVTNMST